MKHLTIQFLVIKLFITPQVLQATIVSEYIN